MAKVCLLFPGQGSQTVGMSKTICEEFPAAQDIFDRASAVLGYDLAALCSEGPAEELDSTVVSQPAIFTLSMAALERLKATEPETVANCEAAAGLSLGEYTALTFAGVFSFEDGLKLVQKRGQAMQDASDAVPGGMVSIIGKEFAEVEAICEKNRGGGTLQTANILCPGNIAVSGTLDACERVAEQAAAERFSAIPLAVAGAFHTPLMKPADEILAKTLAETVMNPPKIPVISNVDAEPHSEPEEIRQILVQQILSPVLWEKSMRKLLADGFDTFYEVGPGRVLRGLMKRIDRKIKCYGVLDV
ncbi:MAG: ACP S-malonyltransferase [Planctomycetaceae bacterium]|jgi:[acyl-carrier-protein] S-malonyltransferase|nr:ACP S-malonyltransferase [Planctomycetaceae bacterium]